MITYYRLCSIIDEQRALVAEGKRSNVECERTAMVQCRHIIENIRVGYRLLCSSLSNDEKAMLARVVNKMLFDFSTDENGSLSWLRIACRSESSPGLQGAFATTEDLLNGMVAISEWDGSVGAEAFSLFGTRIEMVEQAWNKLQGLSSPF